MDNKIEDIEFTRGDTYAFSFQRTNINKEVITDKPLFMWFTVKPNYTTKEPTILKTLEEGIIYDETEHKYYVTIESKETANLSYGDYVFDIQVKTSFGIKTIKKGTLTLTEEVTHQYE